MAGQIKWPRVLLLTLTTLVPFSLLAAWLWPYTMDDAFISDRYALHIAQGFGPIWNLADHASPVEGFTSFLHVWLLGGLSFITGADVVFTGKFIGVVASAILLLAVAREVLRYQLSGAAALVAFSVFILPFTIMHSVSGMETSMYMLWYFLAAITAVRLLNTPSARMVWVFVLLGLLGTLTRPEFALPFLVMTGYLWWRLPAVRPTLLKAIFAAYVVPGLAVTFWRYSFYGDIVPNPFHVKQAQDINRWGINAAVMFVGYCAMPYLIIVAARWRYLWQSHRDLLVLVSLNLAVSIAYFTTTVPLMNIAFRFLLPQIPMLALLAAVSLNKQSLFSWGVLTSAKTLKFVLAALLVLSPVAIIIAVVPGLAWWFRYLLPLLPLFAWLGFIVFLGDNARFGLPRPFIQAIGVALLVMIILAPIPLLVRLLPIHYSHESRYREVGQRLNQFSAPDRWMVFHDVGALVYDSEWNTIDVVGLNTLKENIQSPCEMQTDLVLTYTWQKSEDIPNPCPGTYVPNADLPFVKNAFLDSFMRVYARSDITYAKELRASLLDDWPGQAVREADWLSWYWTSFREIFYQ